MTDSKHDSETSNDTIVSKDENNTSSNFGFYVEFSSLPFGHFFFSNRNEHKINYSIYLYKTI